MKNVSRILKIAPLDYGCPFLARGRIDWIQNKIVQW